MKKYSHSLSKVAYTQVVMQQALPAEYTPIQPNPTEKQTDSMQDIVKDSNRTQVPLPRTTSPLTRTADALSHNSRMIQYEWVSTKERHRHLNSQHIRSSIPEAASIPALTRPPA
jgi:hypothetical protein